MAFAVIAAVVETMGGFHARPQLLHPAASHPRQDVEGPEVARHRHLHAVRHPGLARPAQHSGGAGPTALPAGTLRRTVYDCHQGHKLPGKLVLGEGGAVPNDAAVKEAYESAGSTYSFYREIMQRNSVDDRGMRLDSSVHYREDPQEPFDNAFWNGEQMVYGDGDGIVFTRFTKSLDVIAHELTHGVTQFEAALDYHNQPGALNESMSDVFGSMVKQWARGESVAQADWLIGKELFLGNGALRSMKAPGTAYDDPRIGKDPQPDKMSAYANLPDTRNGDWGGVHVNSGIPNRAFYLSCVNLGAARSWDKGGRIWYRALTSRLRHDSNFVDAAHATISAASELFGATEADAVTKAWQEVEVLPVPVGVS